MIAGLAERGKAMGEKAKSVFEKPKVDDSKSNPVLRGLCGVFYWIVLVLQVFLTARTWRYTITYDYFCGNPLMGAWSFWFMISVVAGLILLPGGLWALRHRQQRSGIIYGVGFLLYLASILFTFLAGVLWGTAPDFFLFLPW